MPELYCVIIILLPLIYKPIKNVTMGMFDIFKTNKEKTVISTFTPPTPIIETPKKFTLEFLGKELTMYLGINITELKNMNVHEKEISEDEKSEGVVGKFSGSMQYNDGKKNRIGLIGLLEYENNLREYSMDFMKIGSEIQGMIDVCNGLVKIAGSDADHKKEFDKYDQEQVNAGNWTRVWQKENIVISLLYMYESFYFNIKEY